jgi:hypothetical protein
MSIINSGGPGGALGGGDVNGPGSAVDGDIVLFDGTSGKLIKDGLELTTTVGSPGSDAKVASEKAVRTALAGAGGGGGGYINILPLSYSSIGQGTWALYFRSVDWACSFLENTSVANGDNITYPVYLMAGTYTLLILTVTQTDGGKVDIALNGTVVGTVDQYASLADNVRQTITGIVVASAGIYNLKWTVNGKNAGSSGYHVRNIYMCMYRTS